MKYKRSVYQSMALVTQFGISMIVPILLCTYLGVVIGEKISSSWIVVPLFVLGALAGARNVHIMAKKIYNDKDKGSRHVKKNQ